MGAKKYFVQILCVLVVFFSFCIARAESGIDLPVNVLPSVTASVEEDTVYLAPYIRYAFNLDAKDAKSALSQKNKFLPYDVLSLKKELGTYWFLISFDKIKDKDTPTAYLDLGNFLPKNSHVLVYSNSSRRWQVLEDVYTAGRKSHEDGFDVENKNNVNIFHSGLYDLTSLRDGGELLIYSPGVPSIWFSPKLLSPAKAPLTLDKRLTPLLLLGIFVLMVFMFWRGAKEEGDARIWASFLALAVIVQFAWGVPQNVGGRLDYLDMVGVVASCLAIFFLPHIGRHLLVTEKKSPHFDSLLQFLAIPAIFPLVVLFVPIPEYLYIIRFAPLWALYALALFVLTVPLVFAGRKGAKLYAFFCLALGAGCLGALALRHDSEWYFLNYLGVAAAMIAIFLAPRQTEKNIFDEKLNHEDIVSAFAENNTIMRDALYRVELKLRDPFDRIMREACFLDFDLKTEDLSDSLALLNDKKAGDVVERHTRNAIEEVSSRTERLQEHTSSLVLACRDLSGMLGHITDLAQKEPVHADVHELFNVKTLITQACDAIRAEAQDRQIGLGWYIAPNIGLHYRGDKAGLETVLSLLLRDAVRATEKGMISVRVRRANSPNPGHIVFTISDSGKGRPPVRRSILTLVKAWELSSAHSGEVELRSSPNGLSFSFSMQCLAMDQNGEKPLSYASLDDIVLSHAEQANSSKNVGLSGGNIVFVRENANDAERDAEFDAEQSADNAVSGAFSHKDTGILIISPLAIQRQNFVYYLNKYETWEALDVESALAFYEKKPASLVLVHSALSANGCSAVLAGIRLLEDNLGIRHAPCVGLYQSVKDMEFLRLAGCNHTLPDNIGREDLCTAVAEILGDKSIQPITDIDASHSVVKKVDQKVQKAVEKRLKTERVHVGSVVDSAIEGSLHGAFDKQVKETEQKTVFSTPVNKIEENEFLKSSDQTKNVQPQAEAFAKAAPLHESKQNEQVLVVHEEKGVFSKFMQALRPKPQMSLQDNERDYSDGGVGEPTPIMRNAAENSVQDAEYPVKPEDSSAEFLDYAEYVGEAQDIVKDVPKENWQQDTLASDENSANLTEYEAEGTADDGNKSNAQKEAEDFGAELTEIPAEQAVGFGDNSVLSGNDGEQDNEEQDNRKEQAESEQKEIRSLNFLPVENEYQVEIDEDLPPVSVQNALEEFDGVEEITEKSVFVQSGLVALDNENAANEAADIENRQDSSVQEDSATSKAENQAEREEDKEQGLHIFSGESVREKDFETKENTAAFEMLSFEPTEQNEAEQKIGIAEENNRQAREKSISAVAEEIAIIELSQDMLVCPQQNVSENVSDKLVFGDGEDGAEKHKKKHRRKKEEKSEKVGLDIMLDYTVSKSYDNTEKKEDAETRHDDRLIQLSFFPANDGKTDNGKGDEKNNNPKF